MLVIAGHVKLDPAKRDEAVAAAAEMMEATRAEAGCRAYVFSEDLATPGLFHLFEEWEDAEALDAHFREPHMAAFQSRMPGFGIQEMVVHRYEVTSKGPLGG